MRCGSSSGSYSDSDGSNSTGFHRIRLHYLITDSVDSHNNNMVTLIIIIWYTGEEECPYDQVHGVVIGVGPDTDATQFV